MNKKFLSAILFGALMVSSTGTFVSCKDYDDDIDRIDKELSEVKETIASLDSAIKAGKFVQSCNEVTGGYELVFTDGSKLLSRMVLMEQMVLLLSLNSVWKAITGRLAQTKVLLGWM